MLLNIKYAGLKDNRCRGYARLEGLKEARTHKLKEHIKNEHTWTRWTRSLEISQAIRARELKSDVII